MSRKPRRGLIPVIQRPSPNHSERKTPVDMVVLHYTGMSSLPQVLEKLCDPASELSAHFVVDIDGRIFQLVPENRRAWHAGVSNWQGSRDVNSRSIGIEIMNNGRELFTHEQMRSVVAICRAMIKKYDIPLHHIVGHSDVAPGRKEDPGPYFPWEHMAHFRAALHPVPNLRDYFSTAKRQGDTKYIREQLTHLGYGQDYSPNPQPDLRQMIAAFQSRYEPDVFNRPELAGIPTRRTLAMLSAVRRANDRSAAEHAARPRPAPPKPPKPKGPSA